MLRARVYFFFALLQGILFSFSARAFTLFHSSEKKRFPFYQDLEDRMTLSNAERKLCCPCSAFMCVFIVAFLGLSFFILCLSFHTRYSSQKCFGFIRFVKSSGDRSDAEIMLSDFFCPVLLLFWVCLSFFLFRLSFHRARF